MFDEATAAQRMFPSASPKAEPPKAEPPRAERKPAEDPQASRMYPDMAKPAPGEVEAKDIVARIRGVSQYLPENADRGLTDEIQAAAKKTLEQRQADVKEYMAVLNLRHGPEQAAALIEEAKKIAGRDPRLKRLLNSTNAGDSAPVIRRFIDLAVAEREAKGNR